MSGLEPLAVLGLVCNIVQLVEVGLKTAKLCKNAYRTGEPDPELSIYAENLAVTASSLGQYLEVSPQPLNLDDMRLLNLARSCRDAEDEWRKKTPARFLSQQQPRKRYRFGAILRSIINKPEIDRLETRLQRAKASLETDLLVGVFQRLDFYKVQIDEIQGKLQSLLQATSSSEKKFHDLIRAQVALVSTRISDRIEIAEASTRALVTRELAGHESRLKSHADKGRSDLLTEAEAREGRRRETEAYERLLRSFHHPDMNDRRNEIHLSHKLTFRWIFKGGLDDDTLESDSQSEYETDSYNAELVCRSFARWLQSTEDRYWISGRPGTGKSVLMKFIISHMKTLNLLKQWQSSVHIITHFFWKFGRPMQSSLKGFLCSLAYQLLSSDKRYAMGCLQQKPGWSRKVSPSDWDSEDLQLLITGCLSLPAQHYCFFIDGLDEFVDGGGVGVLFDFIDNLQSSSQSVKICMSSRPEQAIRMRMCQNPDLKMQDLTRSDIKRYTRATLRKEIALANSSIRIENLVTDISDKAEGVFLWAVLVTRSIARGISNGDSEKDIQQRLLKTPKELHDLYLDMWNRLGEDSDLYKVSTALIFKLALFVQQSPPSNIDGHAIALATPTASISILELVLASGDDLWPTPENRFDGICVKDLEHRCSELRTRLPVRTADLFEAIHITNFGSSDKTSFPILKYDSLRVQAIHRTVFDFLIETEGGNKIIEHHEASREELFLRIFKSCLIRDCLWPEVYFYTSPPLENPNRGRAKLFKVGYRLVHHLESLAAHGNLMKDSVLDQMLDLAWTSLVRRLKNPSLHVDPRVNDILPRNKLSFLLCIAPMGFDSYIRSHLDQWKDKQQFVLYQLLIACLFGHRLHNDFEWTGRHRLIEHIILAVLSADKFYLPLSKGLSISSDTVAKTGMACFLVSAVAGFLDSQRGGRHSTVWGADRISAITKTVGTFREVLCFEDRLLIAVNLEKDWTDPPGFISCECENSFGDVYIKVSISTLVQVFLQHVALYDAAFDIDEAQEALNLKPFAQSITPVALRSQSGRLFCIPSADYSITYKLCQALLLPDFYSPGIQCLKEVERCRERLADAIQSASSRVKTETSLEDGIGPDWIKFYPYSSCEEKESV
ncbi:NACHT domain-containing protein [Fusarium pseudoanthophilum]|uniref:NACHT domain-containing protein n=1 Tax=Fusarium pseudoanthophilum TaxID=48495 RepID=A0A8H5K8G8_9HYPO|nr:NACHT domain-containing protein [Fusarium pseudoanthophilum]